MIYLYLFFEFFVIGLFTFGGGYAMIPLVRQVVIERGWMSEALFLDFLAVAESTPGPIAINMATFVGATQGGVLGSLVATIGVVLPSFIIIILIASLLKHLLENPYVKSFLNGIKPVILGLILSTGLILLAKSIGYSAPNHFHYQLETIIIMLVLLTIYFGYKILFKKKINSILFILLSASTGLTTFMISALLS